MRGLEEIRKINENPAAHYASREPQHFGPGSHDSPDRPTDAALQKILEEITGGKPKAAADKTTSLIGALLSSAPPAAMTGKDLAEMLAVATVFDKLGIPAPDDYDEAKKLATVLAVMAVSSLDRAVTKIDKTLADRSRLNDKGDRARHLGMEGIHSAIDAQPPFLKFWQKLNDERDAKNLGEASYGEAKQAFTGGPTPVGALTFVGKDWDGLRAIPATSPHGRTYHGEFRQTLIDGSSVWRLVASQSGTIAYATPEAALNGARHARIHSEAKQS